MTEVEVLVKAKELLNAPNGWIRNSLSNGKGGYCAVGACLAAGLGASSDKHLTEGQLGLRGGSDSVYSAVEGLRLVTPGKCIVHYNNYVAQTLEEMNQVFCKAIDGALEKEGVNRE